MSHADELACWALLHALPGMGPITLRRLIDRFGAAHEVLDAPANALREVRGLNDALTRHILHSSDRLDRASRLVESLRRRNVEIVRMGDSEYPSSLGDLPNPPPLLYLYGRITREDARSVSIVGTTKPSKKGRPITEEFASRFAAAGVTVVSGYAHGIDAAAHRGAFKGGGRSILCIPYGIRRFKSRVDFPPLDEIGRRGAVISECPPDQQWSSAAAVARDRIIAALGRVTFVVETRPRGGTLHTIRAAEQLRRPVFAVKYAHAPESARGNSILIGRGAVAVSTFGEIGAVLDAIGGRAQGDQA